MGLGDQLLATGMAKGARHRGKRIAFGDGQQILWDHHSEQIFRGNPNIAPPGSERDNDLEWINYYRGNRLYNVQRGNKWQWLHGFKAIPGEIYFSDEEHQFADNFGTGYIAIEPNVPHWKTVGRNKQWPTHRYDKVAKRLRKADQNVVQFIYSGIKHTIPDAIPIKVPSFRHAARLLRNASLYIGPEGGLHHAAAAVGIPAVVLFGGFIPPDITGYDFHTNLTGGANACGSLNNCEHCHAAMEAIEVDEVLDAAHGYLEKAAA